MTMKLRPAGPWRFYPSSGCRLTIANIRGPWRPSGTVAGLGVFAVVWSTRFRDFWAPLHDFEPADQLRLIEACRQLEISEGQSGGWLEAFLG